MTANLGYIDVKQLQDNLSVSGKNKIANKITNIYSQPEFSNKIKKLAEDIFRIMIKDAEEKVREALSESLKGLQNIPSDIVTSIINDKENIAIPFIKHYKSLSNDDLIRILQIPSINKQIAVAERVDLPHSISEYIADKCPEKVVGVLISNKTAKIYENAYNSIITKYAQATQIQEKIVNRSELPVSVIENIMIFLSNELRIKLMTTHKLPDNLASDIVDQVKEKATLKISEEYSTDKQIEELVHQLYTSNRLNSSIIVRAICMGDLRFFEYSLVYLSDTPISEIRNVLYSNPLDFMVRNLLRKAHIPKSMFSAVFNAINIIKEIRFDCQKNSRKEFTQKVIERILSNPISVDDLNKEDLTYLISKIS